MSTLSLKEKIEKIRAARRKRMVIMAGFLALALTLTALHYFFLSIEKRDGRELNDWVLSQIPAQNCSVFIFLVIWSMAALLITRVFKDQQLLMKFVWAYTFVCLSRMLTIGLVPLNPPRGLIELADPLTGIIYGQHIIINKDLFYSGHTSILFLMFLCFTRKTDRYIALIATLTVAVLLLVQHVHYTIDVLAAPAMVYLIYKFTEKLLDKVCALPGRKIPLINLTVRPILLRKKQVPEEIEL